MKYKNHKLYPCPCDDACGCRMKELCLHCETYGKWLNNKIKEKDFRIKEGNIRKGGLGGKPSSPRPEPPKAQGNFNRRG